MPRPPLPEDAEAQTEPCATTTERDDTLPATTQTPFDAALLVPGDRPGSERVPVRCLRCGRRAPSDQPRRRSDRMAYFCEPCRNAILDEPMSIPGYRVVRKLGAGSTGAVYLAVEDRCGAEHAVKLLLPRAASSERIRKRFLREAMQQARLCHPHIVYVYDLQEVRPGIFCLAMEYVEGGSAADLLHGCGPGGLPTDLAVDIAAQALLGLQHAHEQGIVHRDVKDGNILLSQRRAKLSDFGLAKSFKASGMSGLTRTGEFAGTVAYMAPEQIVNFRNVQPAADLYSVGVTLYHLLTRAFPYDFSDSQNRLFAALQQKVVPLRVRRPDVSEDLARIIERSLQKRPEERFGSAAEMREALLTCLGAPQH